MSNKTKANVIQLPSKKRLSDLYLTGEEVTFDDGEESLTVWVQKLTPKEVQNAVDASRPAKSKITSLKREPSEHPVKWTYYDQVDAAELHEPLDLILFLIQPKLQEARLSSEARLADEEEWSKDDYLDGLRQAWADELYDVFIADQENEEAKRVFDELMRFQEKVDADVIAEEKELIYEMEHLSYDVLLDRVVNKLIDDHGDRALIEEFRRQQLYLATRYNDDRHTLYFESREEIDTLPEVVFNKIQTAYVDISVDSLEGKD